MTSADEGPLLRLEHYEGPLDLLLDHVRARRIDLTRLSILEIVEQFAVALEAALRGQRLERLSEWVVTAATLVLLRSRLLLPAEAPERVAAERDAEALRQQLLRRERLADAAVWLERRPRLGREVHLRGGEGERRTAERGSSAADLLEACLTVLDRGEQRRARWAPPVRHEYWTVHDALERIAALLPVLPDGSPMARYLPEASERATGTDDPVGRMRQRRAAMAGTLMAWLELARQGIVELQQDTAFMDIRIHVPQATVAPS